MFPLNKNLKVKKNKFFFYKTRAINKSHSSLYKKKSYYLIVWPS